MFKKFVYLKKSGLIAGYSPLCSVVQFSTVHCSVVQCTSAVQCNGVFVHCNALRNTTMHFVLPQFRSWNTFNFLLACLGQRHVGVGGGPQLAATKYWMVKYVFLINGSRRKLEPLVSYAIFFLSFFLCLVPGPGSTKCNAAAAVRRLRRLTAAVLPQKQVVVRPPKAYFHTSLYKNTKRKKHKSQNIKITRSKFGATCLAV